MIEAFMTQSYANHAHRPTATIVGYVFLIVALIAFGLRWFEIGGRRASAIGLFAIICSVATLLAISRLYITRLQDRIIRLEMRVRGAALLNHATTRDADAADAQAGRCAPVRLRC